MTCQSCVKAVTSALTSLDGVENVSMSLPNCSATVNFDPSLVTEDQLIEAIEDSGFETTLTDQDTSLLKDKTDEFLELTTLPPMSISPSQSKSENHIQDFVKTTLSIKGMTCASCVANIERMVSPSTLPGLISLSVNLIAEHGLAEHDPSILPADKLVEAIEDVGFE